MDKKAPKLMNFSRMRDIFEPHFARLRDYIFFNDELAIVHGDTQLFRIVMQQKPPFAIDDYRFGIIIKGQVCVNFNLVEKHLSNGMLVFLGPGTIISPISFSEDLEVYGVALLSRFPMPFTTTHIPTAFIGQMRDFQLKTSELDFAIARNIIETLWQLVQQPDYNRQTTVSLVGALMYHYDGLYRHHTKTIESSRSREQTIFDRFIYLINQHARQEHKLAFYAEKMCLTPRYLGTVIHQSSGVTAKEWIDRALIARIQVELRHTDKSVSQISEEMNFPNPSFFSKFFKRLTGISPSEYGK